MLYLRENLTFKDANVVYEATENSNGGKDLYMKGICIQGGVENANKRVYPVSEITNAVTTINEQIKEGNSVLGEVDHPDDLKINLDRVSHNIISLRQEGNNFIGKAKLLDTPMGNIAKSLIGEGVKLGVSSRGVGSISETKQGYKLVGEDFMLATAADIVADPSAPDAFVQGIMEGKEWVFVNGLLKESDIESARSTIDKLVVTRELEEKKVQLFQDFLSNL